jgi:hypothetical protein
MPHWSHFADDPRTIEARVMRLRERLGVDPRPFAPIKKPPRQRSHALYARLRAEEERLIERSMMPHWRPRRRK